MISQQTSWHVDEPYQVDVQPMDIFITNDRGQLVRTFATTVTTGGDASIVVFGTADGIREAIGAVGQELATVELSEAQANGAINYREATTA